MQRFTVSGLGVDAANNSPVVLLREQDGERVLPIWIGPGEANAIALRLADLSPTRPLTHDLLKRVIEGAGLMVRHVAITDIRDHTFFAEIVLEGEGRVSRIDARPSDSIALALRTEAPILVTDGVYEKEFGVRPEHDPGRFERLRQRLRRIEPGALGDLDP